MLTALRPTRPFGPLLLILTALGTGVGASASRSPPASAHPFLRPACRSREGNFTGHDPGLLVVAEQARLDSALYWTGEPLPGRWSQPCPITWTRGPAAGGATRFTFDRGEVSGWQMTLTGPRDDIVSDVLPHEVDHMVRASLVRRPIPRWLDEGCATLRESEPSRLRIRSRLTHWIDSPLSPEFLNQLDYPEEHHEMTRVYVIGASIVEFLIDQHGPAKVLALQQDSRPPTEAIPSLFGTDPVSLIGNWREWARDRLVTNSPLTPRPPTSRSSETLPKLLVFSSRWCGPCRALHRDFSSDPSFRQRLLALVDLHWIDADQSPDLIPKYGITQFPTFVIEGRQLTGYDSSERLLRRLRKLLARSVPNGLSSAEQSAAQPSLSADPRSAPTDTTPASAAASTEKEPAPDPSGSPGQHESSRTGWLLKTAIPLALRSLPCLGVAGTTAATGGVGGIALACAWRFVQRRRRRRLAATRQPAAPHPEAGGADHPPAPFPRELDEARQLLQLRQAEGRVAVLDALRGLFLDDELDKLSRDDDGPTRTFVARLRKEIDQRVSEVAPLSVNSS